MIGENIGEWVKENCGMCFKFLIGVEIFFLVGLNYFLLDLFFLLFFSWGVEKCIVFCGVIFFCIVFLEGIVKGDWGIGLYWICCLIILLNCDKFVVLNLNLNDMFKEVYGDRVEVIYLLI